MSTASEVAQLTLLIADYAVQDAEGKLNIIGGGLNVLGSVTPGQTNPFAVLARAQVPSRVCPIEAVLELALFDDTGELVVMPGTDRGMRFSQVVMFEKARVGTALGPPDLTWSAQIALNLSNGLAPVRPGSHLRWSLRIDGDEERSLSQHFVVAAPPPQPVIG